MTSSYNSRTFPPSCLKNDLDVDVLRNQSSLRLDMLDPRWGQSGLVNGLPLYCAFLTSGHSKRFTHSPTDGGVNHARRQPARREQLR